MRLPDGLPLHVVPERQARHHGHRQRWRHPRSAHPVTRYLRPQAEACPGCEATTGVLPITGTSPKVAAWRCAECDTSWAITAVRPQQPAYFDELGAAVDELGRLRWILRQVVALADDVPKLTDAELRDRLLALAESCGAR